MVRTRKSIPDASGAVSEPEESLADLDTKEARRLQTNAHFGDPAAASSKQDLGTYHWRGAVYAIEPHTPREWIEQGEAEWAETLKNRERKKMEKEKYERERDEELNREREKKRRRVESEKEEAARKKKQKSVEMDMDKMSLAETAVKKRKHASPPKRKHASPPKRKRSEASKSRTHPQAQPASSSRRREKDSQSSTASSTIEVTYARGKVTQTHIPASARGRKAPGKHQKSPDMSESDSTDLPTLRGTAAARAARPAFSHTTRKRPATKTKASIKAAAIRELTQNLWALGKINDRLDVLRRWYDKQNTVGAFQRIVVIAQRIRDERGGVVSAQEKEELLSLSDQVGGENVRTLLNMAVAEEEQLEMQRRVSEGQEHAAREEDDAMSDEEAPPPPAPHFENETLQQHSSVPTPPASDSDESQRNHDEQEELREDAIHQPTPPASDASITKHVSPRVHIPQNTTFPAFDKAGKPLRWSVEAMKLNNIQLKKKEMADPSRAEYAIVTKRLEGESAPQKRRRVHREMKMLERATVDGWTIIPDPNAGDGDADEAADQIEGELTHAARDVMEGIVYESEDDESRTTQLPQEPVTASRNKGKDRANW